MEGGGRQKGEGSRPPRGGREEGQAGKGYDECVGGLYVLVLI